MLRCLIGTPTANQKKCPRTTALLAKIPNLYQAFFSILDPGNRSQRTAARISDIFAITSL
jgi:hypothetical protein